MDTPNQNPEPLNPQLPADDKLKKEESLGSATNATETMSNAMEIDRKQQIMSILQRQSIILGAFGGFAAAILGAIIWAETAIILDDHKYAYMAVLVGLLVGFSIRLLGKGVEKRFGWIGFSIVLLGCLLGNLFSVVAYVVEHFDISYWETIMIFDFSFLIHLLEDRFTYPDLFFYATALFVGYKISFRELPTQHNMYV